MPDGALPETGLTVREYGASGPTVILLHGGPGAPGYLAPVAQRLATSCRVLEPFQRGSGGETLTVARHVADLYQILAARDDLERSVLVGHSWGAMLALAFAAEHPDVARSLVLVSCGTFDATARGRLELVRERRVDDDLRRQIERLEREVPDPDERLSRIGQLLLPAYSHDLVDDPIDFASCDAGAYHETWNDMLRLQTADLYPAVFATIGLPVLMLHGAADPHPGSLIRASLEPYLPQLEYHQWERCGHYPWLERAVREEFFTTLTGWIDRHSRG